MTEEKLYENELKPERAIAISVTAKSGNRDEAIEHLDELEFLCETAGATIVFKILQELDRINPATAIGKGKLEEIKLMVEDDNISLIIFDDDLSPVQVRNLENNLKIKVIDRSGLILDIFAKRAQTVEAKTQVELAQLQYMMPRLTRMWTHLSKQYGGIGTKGPGETQIETDRRVIRYRIQKLKDKLDEIDVQKEQQRKGRDQLPQFALVGYTNAGKSTLMNAVTQAGVYVEDKLFATLDTTVRSFYLPNTKKALLSDTVGFIRKLPHHLVASFRSTLAEAKLADVLLHVVDVSHPKYQEQIEVVRETLESLNLHGKPTLMVFNKIDQNNDYYEFKRNEDEYDDCIFVSALKEINIIKLLESMMKIYDEQSKTLSLELPYTEMSLVNMLYSTAEVIERKDIDTGIKFEVKVFKDKSDYFINLFSRYLIS